MQEARSARQTPGRIRKTLEFIVRTKWTECLLHFAIEFSNVFFDRVVLVKSTLSFLVLFSLIIFLYFTAWGIYWVFTHTEEPSKYSYLIDMAHTRTE